jgi:hypothetical protein
MSALDDGFGGYLVLALVGFLVHEPWRWLGLVLGRNLTVDSEAFLWVKAVASALVAGLVFRLLLFPVGALADVSFAIRLLGFLAGVAAFVAFRRSMGLGVAAGALTLVAALWASG